MPNRSVFAGTWWGKKWIEALENFDVVENRCERGRSYARNENVKTMSTVAVLSYFFTGFRPRLSAEHISDVCFMLIYADGTAAVEL
jgi:hypothetical protein